MRNRTLSTLAVASLLLLAWACSSPTSSPARSAAPAPPAVQPASPVAVPVDASKAYVCPMPECQELKDHPGKCSKCGMDLVEVNRADLRFTCTMCNVVEKVPGKCPKCGMALVMSVAKSEAPPAPTSPGT